MTSDVLERVTEQLADRASSVTNPRVTVGEGVVLVELSHPLAEREPDTDGDASETLAGIAHRPVGTLDEVGIDVDAASPSALLDLATGADTYLGRAIGVTTANALSVPDIDWEKGDPMAALAADVESIATVGFFGPAFRSFDAVEVRVIERDPPESVDAPEGVTVELFGPADCRAAFAGVDLCFLTGSVFVYGGLDRYLSVLDAAGVTPVVLVGATASQIPGPAFDAGVDVVAGARVTDPAGVRERVVAGQCATDLHDNGVEKVYVAASDRLPGLSL